MSEGLPQVIPPHDGMRVPVRIYANQQLPPPPQAVATLVRLASSKVLADAIVALPDLHQKPQLECPSSVVTATHSHLVLGLSSPSPNCGMALARTALHIDEITDATLDALFGELARRLTLTRRAPILSRQELVDVLRRGAEAAVEWYALDHTTLDHMDQHGNALGQDRPDSVAILQAVPESLLEIGTRDFSLVGRGNHFLELQVVEELLEQETARTWGLTKGQIVVMYHADSGRLGALVGRLYAHRRKNTWRGRLYEWRVKLPFQFVSGSPLRMLHRIHYHVLPRRQVPIPVGCEEGQRTLLALGSASNYAYGNRIAVLAVLRDTLCALWGENYPTPELLWDSPHNSIRQEVFGIQKLWVHRHNAASVLPQSQLPAGSPFKQTGQPVLLPGLEHTSSYVCAADEGSLHTLHSVNHGAGQSARHLGRPLGRGGATRIYGYEKGLLEMRPHLSDEGLQAVLAMLQAQTIVRPVARLRPLAVLKGSY